MRKYFYFLILILNISILNGQVGIGTETPRGQLEVTSGKDLNQGLVLPNVSKLEDVINTSTLNNDVATGTTIFDSSRNSLCMKNKVAWICINSSGESTIVDPTKPTFNTYIKASNTDPEDYFGYSIALSKDGSTLAVGSVDEASNSNQINVGEDDNTESNVGAVYVYVKNGNNWVKQAYIKASNSKGFDQFGYSISLSDDGNTLAVGAPSDSDFNGGSAYIYKRNGSTWTEQTTFKGSNNHSGDRFGNSITLSGNGTTLVVGSENNRTNDPSGGGYNGAVYVYVNVGNSWNEQAFLDGNNTDSGDFFGSSVSLSFDGNTLAVGAHYQGVENVDIEEGGAYIFVRNGSTWTEEAHLKASNKEKNDYFGYSIALSSDGKTLVVGAPQESSNSKIINQGGTDNSAENSGAAYVFVKSGATWAEQAYIKPFNTGDRDHQFGYKVSISADGNLLAVSAPYEESNSTEIDKGHEDTSLSGAGAVYTFIRNGSTWSQKSYIKAHNTDASDEFGSSIALSSEGSTLAVGAINEASNSRVINQGENNNSMPMAGAAYIYKIK